MPGFDIGKEFDDCYSIFGFGNNGIALSGQRAFVGPNTSETARNNRFRISIYLNAANAEVSEVVSFACETIDRPIIKTVKEAVWNGADFMHVPLRQAPYDPITVVLYEIVKDYISTSFLFNAPGRNITVAEMLKWWTNGVFDPSSSRTAYPEARRTTVSIEMLNGIGDVIWEYNLLRCWPEMIQGSSMNHTSSDISRTTLSLSFDRIAQGAFDTDGSRILGS
jgi:hypothetical protein